MDYTNRDRHRKRKKNKKQADELQMQWWRRRFDYIVLVRFSKLPSMTCKLHALLSRNIFVPFGFVEWNRLKWLKYFKYHDTNKTKRNTLLAFMKKKFAVPVLINSVTWCGIKASDKKKKRIKKAYVPLIDNHLTSDQTKWKKWRRKREEKSMFTTFLSYEIMIIIFTGNMWNIRSAHFRDSLAWKKKLSTTEQNETIT